jgi:DNA-binding response OmpR family regulator
MKKRILIVDDDPMIRNLVQAILEGDGFEVIAADDGPKGIQILDSEPRPINISLVVLDVMMPGMNGLDVLTRMRIHPHTQKLPVVMLTGEDKAEDIMAGYSVGADYYITKPFTRQQLLYGINLVLGGAAE